MKVIIPKTGKMLARNLTVASSLFMRMKGLLGKKRLSRGEGIWLKPCKGVHTFGMRFPIDVIVLDQNLGVIAIISDLKPNRITGIFKKAVSVLELPADSAQECGLLPGDIVEMIA